MTIHVFITLKEPSTETQNLEISRILNDSLLRIQNQTFTDVKVYVICSTMPFIKYNFINVTYKLVDIPFPYKNGSITDIFPSIGRLDKGMKLLFALQTSEIKDDEFIYFLDYDDLVNINLFQEVSVNADYDVIFLSRGYVLNEETKNYLKVYGINLYCGSTFFYKRSFLINNLNIANLKINDLTLDDLFLKIDKEYFKEHFCDHSQNYFHFKKCKVKMKDIDMFSVAWVVGNGQNLSNVKSTGEGLKIDSEFCESFSIQKIESSRKIQDLRGAFKYCNRLFSTRIKWFLSKTLNRAFY